MCHLFKQHSHLLQKHVSLSELSGSSKRVLYYTHDRSVGLWGQDVTMDHHQLLYLGLGLQALRNVHVHLISIEISIVWSSNTVING